MVPKNPQYSFGEPAGAHVRGEGRPKTGPSPVDRGKPGSKHYVITEGHGIPLAVSLARIGQPAATTPARR